MSEVVTALDLERRVTYALDTTLSDVIDLLDLVSWRKVIGLKPLIQI